MTEEVQVATGDALLETQLGAAAVAAELQGSKSETAEPREIPFVFTGNASEYFRIWIINTLLTIATLGVFSAWAKVRAKQYFYRNTSLDGVAFDYLGDPVAILKGRIIVAVALGLVAWSHYYSPIAYAVAIVLLSLLTPWVAVRSLAFNARNSSYRNIRFAFAARVGESYAAYLKVAAAYALTCGLGYPWSRWQLTRFVAWRHYYGDLGFSWHTKIGAFYRAHLIALALAVPGYAVLFTFAVGTSHSGVARSPFAMWVPLALFSCYLLLPAAFLRATLSNLLYGGLMVGEHGFESRQRTVPLLKLYAVNALAILLSLGLLIPWAKIRLAQYRASTLTLLASGAVRAEALLEDRTNALGEGMHDLGDFDLGIGT